MVLAALGSHQPELSHQVWHICSFAGQDGPSATGGGGGPGVKAEGPRHLCVADGLCQEKRCLFTQLPHAWCLMCVFVSSLGFAGTPEGLVGGSGQSWFTFLLIHSWLFIHGKAPPVLVVFTKNVKFHRNVLVTNRVLICCIASPSGVCVGPTITQQSFPRSLQQPLWKASRDTSVTPAIGPRLLGCSWWWDLLVPLS